ncbi:hypothetical protein LTR94_035495, partial [Friedmanniomyces endolithicus]
IRHSECLKPERRQRRHADRHPGHRHARRVPLRCQRQCQPGWSHQPGRPLLLTDRCGGHDHLQGDQGRRSGRWRHHVRGAAIQLALRLRRQ